jgi:hypothetical protein
MRGFPHRGNASRRFDREPPLTDESHRENTKKTDLLVSLAKSSDLRSPPQLGAVNRENFFDHLGGRFPLKPR